MEYFDLRTGFPPPPPPPVDSEHVAMLVSLGIGPGRAREMVATADLPIVHPR